jgi:hypothetical protein
MLLRIRTIRLLSAGVIAFVGLTVSGLSSAAVAGGAGITVIPSGGASMLTPKLSECPTLNIQGSQGTVKGTGFSATSEVTLTWDAKSLATAKTSSKGAFTKTFNVPAAVYGSHTVAAKDSHGVMANQLVRVSGSTCFNTAGTSSLTVKWGVGGVDPHSATSNVFNNATVDHAKTNTSGAVNTTFHTSCQHGTTNWVVNVIQGGQVAHASGTFTPTC